MTTAAANMTEGAAVDSDRIERSIDIQAPVSRVWRAITDHRQFGEWFRVSLEGPFEVGKETRGMITHPGYEHVVWRAVVKEIRPETLFAFTWHPYAVDPDVDYSAEPQTLVEFRLAPSGEGTHLVVTESGFDRIPAHRRGEALRMNDKGWAGQVKNIARYVADHP